MSTGNQLPEEFRARPDTYSGVVPMHVEGAWYKDGVLVHSTLREEPEVPAEEQPGWTVQGR